MFSLRNRMQKGDLAVGIMISELRNPNFVHLLVQGGFDFFIIDNEHGAYSPETVSDIIAAARGGGNIPDRANSRDSAGNHPETPGFRGGRASHSPGEHRGTGARGHPSRQVSPGWQPGVALRRPHSLYKKVVPTDYLRQANEETLIAVQVENPLPLDGGGGVPGEKG